MRLRSWGYALDGPSVGANIGFSTDSGSAFTYQAYVEVFGQPLNGQANLGGALPQTVRPLPESSPGKKGTCGPSFPRREGGRGVRFERVGSDVNTPLVQ